MRRLAFWMAAGLWLAAAAPPARAQATFKVPFPFQAGTRKLPKGDYAVAAQDATHLLLRQEATGKEFPLPFSKRLAPPSPPPADSQLVIDVVGDFAPSYTEYITDYVLGEVWLKGSPGYLIHEMKGAHNTQVIKAQKSK